MCYSHKDKLLVDHLNNVFKIGYNIYKNSNLNFPKIKNEFLDILLKNILLLHDFGKSTKFFQEYLFCSINGKNYENELIFTKHSLLSAIYAGYKTFLETENTLLSIICFFVILKHHGDLNNFEESCFISENQTNILEKQYNFIIWEELKKINLINYPWKDIKNFIDKLWIFYQDNEYTLEDFFLTKYLYSILVYSDKTEVVLGNVKEIKFQENIYELIPNYIINKFNNCIKTNLNILRSEFYNKSVEKIRRQENIPEIIFINVPTGFGKTLTGLQVAFEIIKKNKSLKRIIYAVPFTSILDQTEEIIKEIFEINKIFPLDKFFIKHHHLADPNVNLDENILNQDIGQFFLENWDKPIILTTFWQIFNTIFHGKNKLNRKFHKICDSVIILDEIQTLQLKYWKLARDILLFLTENMNCKIIYMTATIPLIFYEKEKIYSSLSLKVPEKSIDIINRYNINIIENLNPIKNEQLFCHITKNLKENLNKNFLFVVNTIKESIIFFNKLKEYATENDILFYLSSNIIPKDRKKILKKITNEILKQKENIENVNKRVLLVSTQIIEAGVDIDFDIVYRDLAPLDSIIQSAGRCNRNDKLKGQVYLFQLFDDESNRNFNSFVYETISILPTKNIFKNKKIIDESEVKIILNQYYDEVQNKFDYNIYKQILENIKKFEFKNVQNEFNLIDEEPNYLIFIEKDKDATEILSSYNSIKKDAEKHEFKKKFLSIKKSFYEYVISKRLNQDDLLNLKSLIENNNMIIIPRDILSDFYDDETGFFITNNRFF